MGVEFRLEYKKYLPKYKMVTVLFREANGISYDNDIYSILKNDTVIGYITKYKVPASKCCYIDIFIFSRYRNRGYGSSSLSLFIDNLLSDYNEIYIRSNNIDKNRFLINNKFKFIEENLNKNLYLRILNS